MESIVAIKGFKDILPVETRKWNFIDLRSRYFLENFGFREIRTPILEKTDLFKRGIGTSTDIVEKEMYTFTDRGGDSITMRPEATAGVIRSYIENSIFNYESVSKLYTIGPMFRRERPQKGRFRQFHQINAEAFGIAEPTIDAEIILMLQSFFKSIGLSSLTLEINSLGCPFCRPRFREMLISFLGDKKEKLCGDCRRRIAINTLRAFDCKIPTCKETLSDAPVIIDFICAECRAHFEKLQNYLAIFGIDNFVNKRMVRGLDYYIRTAFEITTEHLGAQNAICGGGRYDGLVKQLGGPDVPGIGFAIGIERLVSLLPETNEDLDHKIFIATIGASAREKTFALLNTLRLSGISCEGDYKDKNLKALMKKADKMGASFVIIVGDDELAKKMAIIKDMKSGQQTSISLDDTNKIIDFIKWKEI